MAKQAPKGEVHVLSSGVRVLVSASRSRRVGTGSTERPLSEPGKRASSGGGWTVIQLSLLGEVRYG